MIRKSSWFAIVAASVASLASAVDPPVVQQGECLWLLGAPAGAPAATTEVAYSGTRVHDPCTHTPHVEVGRDAPNRLTVWQESPRTGGPPYGCVTTAYSEHEFVVEAVSPSVLTVASAGDFYGLIAGVARADSPVALALDYQLVEMGEDGSVRIVATRRVLERAVLELGALEARDTWAATLSADIPAGGIYRARLVLEVRTAVQFAYADAGSPGSGRGASYESIEVCVAKAGGSDDSYASLDLERDLHEKRCLPSLWLPGSQGGHLDDAFDVVGDLIRRAEESGDAGANTALASERLARAELERTRGQYQRACRSLSDAVRALTTP